MKEVVERSDRYTWMYLRGYVGEESSISVISSRRLTTRIRRYLHVEAHERGDAGEESYLWLASDITGSGSLS